MKKLLFGILFLTSSSILFAGEGKGIAFRPISYNEALVASANEGKPIFIDFTADWCVWCKWMDKNMFVIDSIAQYYNDHFICIKVDADSGEGVGLKKRYNVRGLPTYIFLDGQGNVLDRKAGAFIDTAQKPDTKGFFLFGEHALGKEGDIINVMHERKAHQLSTRAHADAYFSGTSRLVDSTSWIVISAYAEDPNGAAMQFLKSHSKDFSMRFGADTVFGVIKNVYGREMNTKLFRESDTLEYLALRKGYLAIGGEENDDLVLVMDMQYHAIARRWEAYAIAMTMYVDMYVKDEWFLLNNFAYFVYQHADSISRPYQEKALGWAKHAVELKENYFTLDTYASLLYVTGDLKSAKKVAKRAIKTAEKDNAAAVEKYGEDAYKMPKIPVTSTEELLKKIEAAEKK